MRTEEDCYTNSNMEKERGDKIKNGTVSCQNPYLLLNKVLKPVAFTYF